MSDAFPTQHAGVPLRIVVKGASTVCIKSAERHERAAFTFPRAIEAHLWARGRANTVTSLAIPGMRTNRVLKDWQQDFLAPAPDVIVLSVGHYETIHLFWPWRLERHANSLVWTEGGLRTLYRRRVLRKAWRTLGRIQRVADRRFPGLRDRRLRAAVRDIGTAINRVRRYNDPLILVMEVPRPGATARAWFPGMTVRVDRVNELMAATVEQIASEQVRMFPTNELIARHTAGEPDTGVTDGFHLTPVLHDEVGRAIAAEVAVWAADRPELRIPGHAPSDTPHR